MRVNSIKHFDSNLDYFQKNYDEILEPLPRM